LVGNSHTVSVEGVLSNQVKCDVKANAVLGARQSPERIEGGHGPLIGLTNKQTWTTIYITAGKEDR
jgi:hypothetical protein